MKLEFTRIRTRLAIVVLAVWAAGLILPEFARVFGNYGTLGFEADNDGIVTSVDGPPAASEEVKLQRGDCIDLHRTALEDRLAVFGSMGGMSYVRPDREVTLYVANGSCSNLSQRATPRVLKASPAPMTVANRVVLGAAQLLGLFFIALATVLVWQQPSAMTWGFFLYAIWFNPGQWFVSYAELERHWYTIVSQQVLQSVAQAVGYAGFVSFALRFPDNRVAPRWRIVETYLPALVVVLTLVQLLSFGTVLGYRAEIFSRWSYWIGYLVDIAVLIILRFRRKEQAPEDQQRTRWVHWGCRVGLIAFIFADSNMATSAWTPVWDSLCPSSIGSALCSGGSASETFLLSCFLLNATVALAVFHAVRRHRVIDVRFALSRGATLVLTSFIIAAVLALVGIPVEHFLSESIAGQVAIYVPIVAGLNMAFDAVHERLKEFCDRLFFRRLHVAEERLHSVTEDLKSLRTQGAVDEKITHEVASALDLASAAIFRADERGRYRRVPQSIGWADDAEVDRQWLTAFREKLERSRSPLRLQREDLRSFMPTGSAQPVVALPLSDSGAGVSFVLYGARRTGDDITDDELTFLRDLGVVAGRVYDHVEVLALRAQLVQLQAK